jgi:hypothetical protein
MKSPQPLCALPAAVAIVLFLGCGGSGAPMKSPEEGAAPETVPEALAELDRAEAELAQAIGSPTFAGPPDKTRAYPEEASKPAETRDASPADAPPTTSPAPAPAQAGGGDAPDATLPPPDPCVTACRALGSMSRSADHICDLAGQGDDRCGNARARVERATDRVRAQCPGCR